jgi:hypothetical protein
MRVGSKLALIAVILTTATAAFGSVPASASDPMVFDRGLPTTNLNNAAGANRSNVAWSNGNDYVSGDDFTIGASGETWVVTGIRTWSIPGSPIMLDPLGDEYSDVSLYTGASGLSLTATGTLTMGSDADSNPDITHTVVNYTDLSQPNYQGTAGSQYLIYQNDFTNLNLVLAGGVKFYFAVDGTPRCAPLLGSSPCDFWFNHASNAALSGSTQQGADDRWLTWPKSALGGAPTSCNSQGPVSGVCDGGWDKTSDINVQVFAHQVVATSTPTNTPAPSTNTPTPTATPAAPTNTATRTSTATAGPLGSVTPLSVGGVGFLSIGGSDAPGGSGSGSGVFTPFAWLLISAAILPMAGVGGWYVKRRHLTRR